MAPIQLDRIKRLFVAWQSVNPKRVSLDDWKCGTHACLAGHAGTLPEFRAEGFRLAHRRGNHFPKYGDDEGFEACWMFFGTLELFEARGCDRADREILSDWPGCDDWTLANQRMQRLLRQHGVDTEALIAEARP